VYRATYRGFKSLILRQLLICFKKKRRPVFLASFPVPSEKDYL